MEGEKKLTVKSKLALIASFVAVFMAASAGFNFVLAWAEPTAPPPAKMWPRRLMKEKMNKPKPAI